MIIHPTGYKTHMPIPYPDEFPGMVAMMVASLLRGQGSSDGELATRQAIDIVVQMQNTVFARLTDGQKQEGV